ncbi:uncharacterized protein B0I36DRAFT_358892 [Microdochium trichocladiopsis]|uniref:Uncharacterized protein n=1 Tax=Microdochium trichocladiopsis TaxID=1682393 RepID=A0A9P8YFU3_9PEZI|nr:uncharacterized protein B0I36DRAFT_358892 [Microdochium trichocladiopsis]KAH7037148.1 hypothetical protein B0I36DRAFT_358892 [Microdochium trichocladiopsis]
MAAESARSAGPPPPPTYWGFQEFYQAEPPVNFFKHVPPDSLALFSTERGKRQFKAVANPDWKRTCYAWPAEKIAHVCHSIRQEFPAESKYLRPIRSYCDLYNYWDAHDIYHYGAQNLNNIINRMIQENEYFLPELCEGARPEFEGWVNQMLADSRFEQRLKIWNDPVSSDILSTIDYARQAELNDLESFYLPVLREVLWKKHVSLQNRSPVLSQLKLHGQASSPTSDNASNTSAAVKSQTSKRPLVVDGTSASAARRRQNNSWLTDYAMKNLPSHAPHHVQLGLTRAKAGLVPLTFAEIPPRPEHGGFPLSTSHNVPFSTPRPHQTPLHQNTLSSTQRHSRTPSASHAWQARLSSRSVTTPHSGYQTPFLPAGLSTAGPRPLPNPPQRQPGQSTPRDVSSSVTAHPVAPIVAAYGPGPSEFPVQVGRFPSDSQSSQPRSSPAPYRRDASGADGRWQAIGNDNLHGVKHAFSKKRNGSNVTSSRGSLSSARHNSINDANHQFHRRSSTHYHDCVNVGRTMDERFGVCQCVKCEALSRTILVTLDLAPHNFGKSRTQSPRFAEDGPAKLHEIFSRFGDIEDIDIFPSRDSAEIRFLAPGSNHVAISETNKDFQPLFNRELNVYYPYDSYHNKNKPARPDSNFVTAGFPNSASGKGTSAKASPASCSFTAEESLVPLTQRQTSKSSNGQSFSSSDTLANSKIDSPKVLSPQPPTDVSTTEGGGNCTDKGEATSSDAAQASKQPSGSTTVSKGKYLEKKLNTPLPKSVGPSMSTASTTQAATSIAPSTTSSTTTADRKAKTKASKKGKKIQSAPQPDATPERKQTRSTADRSA